MKDDNMKQNSPMVSSNSRMCHMHKTFNLWNPESPNLNSRCRPGNPCFCAVFMFLLSPPGGWRWQKRGQIDWWVSGVGGAGRAKDS